MTDDVHVLFGLGGNVGVLATERGAVIVDSLTFRMQGARIRELAEKIGAGRPRPSSTPTTTSITPMGTRASPRAPRCGDATNARLPAASSTRLLGGRRLERSRTDLSRAPTSSRIGGKTVRLLHLGRGHTGGDLVVQFVEDRVLHTGDLFFNGRYPNIDLEAGGSVREWIETIDRVLALDFDRVIPGHGPVTDRDGLAAFQDFLKRALGAGASGRGARRADARGDARVGRASRGRGLRRDRRPAPVQLDRDFVVRRAWEEASGVRGPRRSSAPTP